MIGAYNPFNSSGVTNYTTYSESFIKFINGYKEIGKGPNFITGVEKNKRLVYNDISIGQKNRLFLTSRR